MFKPADKTELNQISLTGMRAIVLIGLLIEAPRTLDEVREKFIGLNIMEPEHSDDILRIDLNTLRIMGCDITKANIKTGYKYTLLNHPFSLTITSEEFNVIKKAYKWIKESANIELILEYHELFNKLAEYISDLDTREILYGLSVLKSFDTCFIKKLLEDCKLNRVLQLSYQTPTTKENSIKNVLAQKLVFENDKIYLYGFDLDNNQSIVLNIKRITSVLNREEGQGSVEIKTRKVKFFLKNFGITRIEDDENILETNDKGYVVEGVYYNDFIAMQRILSFGSECTVLEPEDFRIDIIEKLKLMRGVYNG